MALPAVKLTYGVPERLVATGLAKGKVFQLIAQVRELCPAPRPPR